MKKIRCRLNVLRDSPFPPSGLAVLENKFSLLTHCSSNVSVVIPGYIGLGTLGCHCASRARLGRCVGDHQSDEMEKKHREHLVFEQDDIAKNKFVWVTNLAAVVVVPFLSKCRLDN